MNNEFGGFEADYMDAMSDLWQEARDAQAEADAEAQAEADAETEAEHDREMLDEMRAELHDEDWTEEL